jgi:predicted metal-dependent peptidase
MSDAIELKLAAARTRLILDKPFLGALVLRLPMRPADSRWCQTSATDARHFYYNPDYIAALSVDQVQFVLAHEALHCALSHFARRQHRVKHRWDIACDHAINPLLLADGLKPPPGVWVDDGFLDMTAEEIYPLIGDNNSDQPMDMHLYDHEDSGSEPPPPPAADSGNEETPPENKAQLSGDQPQADRNQGGAPQPPPLHQPERDNLAVQWQQRLAGAAQQAMQAGKLGGAMARMVEHLLQPQLPWRMLLARYLNMSARDDYSYMRPSRREGAAILPRLRSGQVELAVAVDISGSIGDREMGEFLAEIDALKGQIRARVTLLPCDAKLAEGAPWVYEAWDELALPATLKGGGGTRFIPVFDWLAGREPDLLLYFTDADGEFPAQEPSYPVIWLVKGRGKVPWGRRVQLN